MNTILRHIKTVFVVFPVFVAVLLSACGGNSSPPPATVRVAGAAVKGPISGATVTGYALGAGGYGSILGSGTTDASGNFSFSLTSTPAGPVAIVISGGSYKSEVDGSTITNTSAMCAMVADLSKGASGLSITPLSDMACARAKTLAGSGSVTTTTIGDADKFVMGIYGLKSPPEGVMPSFTGPALSSGTDGGKLALVLAALDKLRADFVASGLFKAATSDALYAALSSDISDGKFDGYYSGTVVHLGTGTLPFTAGSTDFVGALSTIPSTVFGTPVTSSDISNVTPGLASVSPSTAGLSATSSGAMSTLAIFGRQYLFVAARGKGVEKIDVTDPANPIVLTATGTAATATAPATLAWAGGSLTSHFPSASVGGAQIIPGVAGVGNRLLVFSYNDKHLVLVDPVTGNVTWEADLSLKNSLFNFSGGSAYVSGAIPASGGAWLATVDGYEFFDAGATVAGASAVPVMGTVYPIAATEELAENMGGDISHGLLFAPNYNGIQVINLGAKASFAPGSSILDPAFVTANGVNTYFDGGTVDSHLQVGILNGEDVNNASFVDFTKVVPGSTANSFAPGTTNGYAKVQFSAGSYLRLSGSAVDPNTDQVLFMAGYSNDLAVGQIQDPSRVAAGSTWTGLSDWVYYTLGNGMLSYSYATDPHAVAVINLPSSGKSKSYGYLLNGSSTPSGVVQIDMGALLAMPRAGTTGDAAHQPLSDPTAAGGPVTAIALP